MDKEKILFWAGIAEDKAGKLNIKGDIDGYIAGYVLRKFKKPDTPKHRSIILDFIVKNQFI